MMSGKSLVFCPAGSKEEQGQDMTVPACKLVRNAGQELKSEGISLYFCCCCQDFWLYLKMKKSMLTTASINSKLVMFFNTEERTLLASELHIFFFFYKCPFKDFFPRNTNERFKNQRSVTLRA